MKEKTMTTIGIRKTTRLKIEKIGEILSRNMYVDKLCIRPFRKYNMCITNTVDAIVAIAEDHLSKELQLV